MKPAEYEKYIKSLAWRKRKDKWLGKYGRFCRICGEKKVHLHHKTYENFTNEKDEDLIALCEFCHDLVHKYHEDSGLELAAATDRCIKLNARLKTEHLMSKVRSKKSDSVIDSEWAARKAKQKEFVPLTLREDYKMPVLSGREGRLNGIPLIIISQGKRK